LLIDCNPREGIFLTLYKHVTYRPKGLTTVHTKRSRPLIVFMVIRAMATSSITNTNTLYANTITEKLTRANHVTWRAQILAVLHGARLDGHVTGATAVPPQEIDGRVNDKPTKLPNLEYDEWYVMDQHIIGFLLASLSKEVLPQVATKTTTIDAWKEIQSMFSSQTRAHSVNTRLQLATTWNGRMMIAEYVNKMRLLADEMAAVERILEEDELVEYILIGLSHEYPIVSVVIAKTSTLSVSELYA
jgi:hypothetical protein